MIRPPSIVSSLFLSGPAELMGASMRNTDAEDDRLATR